MNFKSAVISILTASAISLSSFVVTPITSVANGAIVDTNNCNDIDDVNYTLNASENSVSGTCTVSGYVWLDLPLNKESTTNGIRDFDVEDGLNDMYVVIANADYSASTYTTTIDGITGSYEFTNIPCGTYSVMLGYNMISYQNPIATDDNNELLSSSVSHKAKNFTVKYDGVYDGERKISDSVKYDDAVKDDAFLSTIATIVTVSDSSVVNFGLSDSYKGAYGTKMYLTGYSVSENGEFGDKVEVSSRDTAAPDIQQTNDKTVELYYQFVIRNQSMSTKLTYVKFNIYVPIHAYNVTSYSELIGSFSGIKQIEGNLYYIYSFSYSGNLTSGQTFIEDISFITENSGIVNVIGEVTEYSFTTTQGLSTICYENTIPGNYNGDDTEDDADSNNIADIKIDENPLSVPKITSIVPSSASVYIKISDVPNATEYIVYRIDARTGERKKNTDNKPNIIV